MARNFFYFSFHYFKHNVFFGDLASHYWFNSVTLIF
jgi:hypothetical protein